MWTQPPVNLDLQPSQVDVWRVFLDPTPDSVNWNESTLSADETQRASRFHFDSDRQRFIAAHASLRDILARYLHCQPHQITFQKNEYGKPSLLSDPKLNFNLSHSGNYALAAVAREHKVGIDVERLRDDMELESIASRHFSQREISELMALPPEQRTIGFFNCWTRKEAYIKARGLGLSLPLDSFDVSLALNEPVLLRATRPDSSEAARWTLLSLDINSGFAGALAVEGKQLEYRYWVWDTL
jgi:4'-phosphopantetheinyl transferase